MKTNRLISIALVAIMALTVLNTTSVVTTMKTEAATPSSILDYGTALDSGSLQWTASPYPLEISDSFESWVCAAWPVDGPFPDGDGVMLSIWLLNHIASGPQANIAMLTTTVDGPGTISWWWMYQLQVAPLSKFQLVVDGQPVKDATMSVEDGFTDSYDVIGAGPHTLSWKLYIDLASWDGDPGDLSDAYGYLDSVTWTPGPSVTQDTVHKQVTDLADELANPDTTSFKTPQSENAFVNKLNALAALIDAGAYDEAQAKLTNDLTKYNAKYGTSTVAAELTEISTNLATLQGADTVG